MKNLFGYLLVALFGIAAVKFVMAAPKKEARVTAVIKDVRVIGSNAAPKAAALNDSVVEGNAIRTGGDSRAELTFTDATLTRIGANTVFTFGEGAKQFDLASGALLLVVPKSAGTTRVNIGAATAAVSGFTALFEHNASINKLVILEGRGDVSFKNIPGPCPLESGQMMVWPTRPTRCPEVRTVDVSKVMKSAKLVTLFNKLPAWSLGPIQAVIENQQTSPPPGGLTDPTNIDAVSQNQPNQPIPPPHIIKPPGSPPGSF